MNITHVFLYGEYTDNWSYQENLMTKFQEKNGNSVSLITSQWIIGDDGKSHKIDNSDYIDNYGVRIIRLPIKGDKNISSKFKCYERLYSSLEELKPDIIFVHCPQFIDVKTVVNYVRNHGHVKLYADNHADFSNSATNWLSKNILHKVVWKHYVKLLIPYVEKIYGVLPARVDFLVNVYGVPENKCDLLLMGADDEAVKKTLSTETKKDVREKYSIDNEDFLIVTGGKIDIHKKQTILLMKAVQNIDNPRIKLIVFGSVDDELKKQVKSLNDGKKVQYIGWIKAEQSYDYFASANLVIFPGRHSVFWEQVAGQGIPMLCKYWEGTTHVDVGGNVKFLYEDSEQEIRKSILRLYNTPHELEQMKNVAIEKGMTIFSYNMISKKAIGQ